MSGLRVVDADLANRGFTASSNLNSIKDWFRDVYRGISLINTT